MEELIKYYMDETNKRLDSIEIKIDEINNFKVNMIASARLTSFIVSGICGLLSLAITTWVAIKFR